MADHEIMEAIGARQGLARAVLFRAGESVFPEDHAVWLDGLHGSFVLSVSGEGDGGNAASWAWSVGSPHHVAVAGDSVTVTRWDAPTDPERLTRRSVLADPERFYAHLNQDRVRSDRTIVRHCLDAFRSVRALVHTCGLDDPLAIDAYLALLAEACLMRDGTGFTRQALHARFDLPPGAVDLLRALPAPEVEDIAERFLRGSEGQEGTSAFPRLAIRHASGDIFQEAHFDLVSQPPGPDLFHRIAPARGSKPGRGAVHYTPPYLARALAEEAVGRVLDLAERETVTLMDVACGSGAFLVEGLRALERAGYAGQVRVVGRDTSGTAVRMASFAVGVAAREWPGAERAALDIRVGDSLREPLPDADVVLLNPPFAAGQDLDSETRDIVRAATGLKGGHIDLSMGFVSLAARSVKSGGGLAALMPAKLLLASGSSRWRDALTRTMAVPFHATFGELRLFPHATVRVGAVVLAASPPTDAVEVRTGGHDGSAGEALRALRRTRATGGDASGPGGRWSVTRRPATVGWPAAQAEARRPGSTTVTDLFDVLQGVRPGGAKKAFVRSQDEFDRLPASERAWYRRSISSPGIVDGQVTGYVYVFYPYDAGGAAFMDEAALRAAVPETYLRYLAPARERLGGRDGARARWWHLTHRGRRILERSPLLVSKWFALPGGFALDMAGGNLVEQGHALDPREGLREAFRRDGEGTVPDIALAYLAVLNSQAFFAGVARHSDGMVVGGGQIDMSGRHLRSVPLVDMTKMPADIAPLARFARARYLRVDPGSGYLPSNEEVEDWTTEALARARPSGVFPRTPAGALPEWAKLLVDGGMAGPSEAAYLDIIEHLHDLGGDGGDGLREIHDVMAHIEIGGMSELSLITLVRTTFAFREGLGNWTEFRDRVEDELGKRGRPARKVLVGLYG